MPPPRRHVDFTPAGWLLDLGNTNLKLITPEGELLVHPRTDLGGISLSGFAQSNLPLAAGWARREDEELIAGLAHQLTTGPVYALTPRATLPFRIHYRAGQPGADRLANLLFLREAGPPAVAIDFGTATTFTVCDPQGDFAGGAILPGTGLQFLALHQGTNGRLPLYEAPQGSIAPVGDSTQGAIEAGVMLGHAGAVDRLLEEYRHALGPSLRCFATGGTAPQILHHLRSAVEVMPHLTLRGLNSFLASQGS